MAYRKRYTKKTFTRRKRRLVYGRRRKFVRSTRRLATRAYKGVKRIGRLIETKFGEGNLTTAVPSVVGILNPLTVAVGTSQSNRIANQITVTSFQFRMTLTAADTTNLVRVLVFIDKDNLLQGAWSGTTFQQNWSNQLYSYINMANRQKFKILMDQMFTLSTSAKPIIFMSKKFKLRMPVQWDNTGSSNITTIKKNNLCFVYFSDSNLGPDPQLVMEYKTYWQDL